MGVIILPERNLRLQKPVVPQNRKTNPESYLYWVQQKLKEQWENID